MSTLHDYPDTHKGYDRFAAALRRTLRIVEHIDLPFTCAHCLQRIDDGCGFVVSIVEDGAGIPVDGVHRSEACATDEANQTTILEARQ